LTFKKSTAYKNAGTYSPRQEYGWEKKLTFGGVVHTLKMIWKPCKRNWNMKR